MTSSTKILWSATPTPFLADGSLDEVGIGNVVEQHLRLGIDGIFACGTCGEGPFMLTQQRVKLVSALKRIAGDRIHLAVQVSDTSAARVKENMRAMAEAGADSAVIAPPLMTRFCTPAFLRRYFLEPLENPPLPVGLYVFGAAVAPGVSLDMWCEFASHPKIKFVKDSSSFEDIQHALLGVKAARPGLTLMTGNEFNVVSAVAAGYDGALAGTGILIGGMLRLALDALAAGDRTAADAWQERSNECLWGLFATDRSRWLGGLKYALKSLGIFRDDFLHLGYSLTQADRDEIEATLKRDREFILPRSSA